MSVFTGSAVALITPLDENGVKLDALERLINFQINNGTDAILVCGTTGEPSTMTDNEKIDAITCTVNTVNGRVPVIVGTGGNNTKKVIADSLRAQELGADALLIVTPYYNKCTQDGLVAHYTAVADEIHIPIIVYNVPGRTGVNLLPATMAKLAEHKNIVATKEASANIEQIVEIARLCPHIDLYSGNDDHVVPLLALGGKGVISVLANIAPRLTHDMVASFLNGNVELSREIQFRVNPLVKTLFCEVNPIPVKTAAGLMGFDVGDLRLPLTPMTEEHKKLLKQRMQELNLI